MSIYITYSYIYEHYCFPIHAINVSSSQGPFFCIFLFANNNFKPLCSASETRGQICMKLLMASSIEAGISTGLRLRIRFTETVVWLFLTLCKDFMLLGAQIQHFLNDGRHAYFHPIIKSCSSRLFSCQNLEIWLPSGAVMERGWICYIKDGEGELM